MEQLMASFSSLIYIHESIPAWLFILTNYYTFYGHKIVSCSTHFITDNWHGHITVTFN